MYALEIRPLPLVKKTEQGPRQVVEIAVGPSVAVEQAALLKVHVQGSGEDRCWEDLQWRSFEGNPQQAAARIHVPVELGGKGKARQFTFSLIGPEGSVLAAQDCVLSSVREWEIFVVVHSHCDVGFTHPPSEAAAIHCKNLDLALAAVSATSTWPEAARFKWTVENTWQLENYRGTRSAELVRRVIQAAKAGQIEITACYVHNHFEHLGTNQLHRITWEAEWWMRQGVPVQSAMLSDIPGVTWGIVPVLVNAGVRYLFMAPNNFGAPFHSFDPPVRPFRWRGRGGAEPLVWYTGDPRWAYIEGARCGLLEDAEAAAWKLPQLLVNLEAEGYPYNALMLQVAFDNDRLHITPACIVRDWNAAYLWPKLRMALPSEFLGRLEAEFGEAFPIYQGDWPSWWAASVLGYPGEASLSRRTHRQLAHAEALAVLADVVNEAYTYPHAALTAAYNDLLIFDEHSGLKQVWVAFRQHKQAQAVEEGLAYLTRPLAVVAAVEEEALAAVWEKLPRPAEPMAAALNTRFEQGGLVRLDSAAPIPELEADPTWQRLDSHFAHHGSCYLGYVHDVPPLGWKGIPLRPGQAPESRPVLQGNTLANQYYEIQLGEFAPIAQIVDKETGVPLLDSTDLPFGGVVLYQPERSNALPDGDFQTRDDLYAGIPDKGKIIGILPNKACQISTELAADGPQLTSVRRSFPGAELELVWEISLYHKVKRVDITVHVRRGPGVKPVEHMYYLALPFAPRYCEVDHEVPGGWSSPGSRGQIPGSCMDFYAVEDWIRLVDAEGSGVILTSCDAAVVEYDAIKYNQFDRGPWKPQSGRLFFRIGQSGGAWSHLAPAQADQLTLRFALTSGERVSIRDAYRFAQEVYHPFVGQFLSPDRRTQNEWEQGADGFIKSTNENVVITHFFRLEEPGTYLVWLQEMAGKRSVTELAFPGHAVAVLHRCTPAGLAVDEQGISPVITLEPYQALCLRAQILR